MRLRNTFAELHMVPAPILVGCRQFPPRPRARPKKDARNLHFHPPEVWRTIPQMSGAPRPRPRALPICPRARGACGRREGCLFLPQAGGAAPRPRGDRQKKIDRARALTAIDKKEPPVAEAARRCRNALPPTFFDRKKGTCLFG